MPSLIFSRNNKYWNNFPETQFITLKKIKEGESGKKSIFYLKERERERERERSEKQAKSENASYHALKNTTWE